MSNLWQRLGRALRSGLGPQDPLAEAEAAVNELVDRLQGDLLKLRQAVAEAIALQKRTERQQHGAQSQADYWYHQAQDALGRGQEAAARAALEKQWPYRQQVQTMGERVDQQRALVQQLRGTLAQVEQQVMAVRNQRDLYGVRSRSASATLRLREALDTVAGDGAKALERFETQVQILEAQGEVWQLGAADRFEGQGQESLDIGNGQQDRAREGAIADALAALEAEMGISPSSPSSPSALANPKQSPNNNDALT